MSWNKMLKRFTQNDSGNIAITGAIVIVTLLTAIGTAIDISTVISRKTSLQDANDAATLAAAKFDFENTATASANSLDLFNLNQDTSQLENTQFNLSFDEDKITGIATADYPLFFARILPQAKIQIQVKTVVAKNTPQYVTCIKSLNASAQSSFRVNGGANIIAPDCQIDVDSVAAPAADFNSGVTLNVARACVAGTNIINQLGLPNIIKTDCEVNPDPYFGQFPIPDDTCRYNSQTYNDRQVDLNPGVYCGSFNFGPQIETVRFAPGLYVLKDGTWTVDSGLWEGDGVTFYFMDQSSGIQFNSGIAARMTPPTSGPYKDVFITEAPNTQPSNFVMNDAKGFDFEGIIYLPNRQLIMNSGATIRSRRLSLVADRLIINDANLNIQPLSGGVESQPEFQAYITE